MIFKAITVAHIVTENTHFDLFYKGAFVTSSKMLNDSNVFIHKINIKAVKIYSLPTNYFYDKRDRLLIKVNKANATTFLIDSACFVSRILIITISSMNRARVIKKIVI